MKKSNKYKIQSKKQIKTDTFTATVRANERGFAFLIPDDKDKYKSDFFVPRTSMGGAYDGDKVIAEHVKGTKDEARILEIISRGHDRIVGAYERGRVYPDDARLPEVIIPHSLAFGSKNGCKVLCEITGYDKGSLPKGKIIEILGESGDFEAEELSIIRSYGLYEEFPQSVLDEVKKSAAAPILPDGHRDFRDKPIFTIDGADTRDIDDGVSLEMIKGNFVLGVHIADVSRYVKFRSKTDIEAYERGTSVYFPDRVLPMLPKELSNGACSLNEGEDRYALSCVMTFDKSGNRLNYEICESIINSRHKMTYPAVTAICNGDEKTCAEYDDIADTVKNMEKLCLLLEKKRKAAGEVELDVREAKIYLDDDGEIIIPDYERGISERIIEQFMISANEAVAEFLLSKGAPCLYRIHESPSPEKAETLFGFLRDLGINAHCDTDDIKPEDFQRILERIADKPYASVVNKVMLRSMQKARYHEKNLGHFGLASKCYCHFTSPIRRYPDLFVHRSVKAVLHGTKFIEMKDAGIDCSERERNADEAERAVDDLYKTVYMQDRIGEVFDATVSGVTNFGVFCELDNTIEGLIPLEVLPDDNYEFIAEKFLLKGARRAFRLGDKVKIRVDGCDYGRMRTLFSLAK